MYISQQIIIRLYCIRLVDLFSLLLFREMPGFMEAQNPILDFNADLLSSTILL